MSGRSVTELQALAENVVATHYGLQTAVVSVLSTDSFNTIFLVETPENRLVLRLGDACRIHAPDAESIEATWLTSLLASDISAPMPIPNNSGSYTVEEQVKDPNETRVCSLFSWLDGKILSSSISPERMQLAGRLMAELHDQASSLAPTTSIPQSLYADRVVYFGAVDRVSAHSSTYGSMLSEAVEQAQLTIDELWAQPPHSPHLFHGDLTPNNILLHDNQLRPIDFQDLQHGFEQQDLAITLADLERSNPAMIEPFRAGYSARRKLPELPPPLQQALAAARSLNVMNLGLHLRRPGLDRFLASHSRRVAAWMGYNPTDSSHRHH